MSVERTITGNNDGSNLFPDNTESSVASNVVSRVKRASRVADNPDRKSIGEINELEGELGHTVYDTTNNILRYWNGVEWKEVTSEGTINDDILDNRIIVNQQNYQTTICGTIDSTKNYFLDGIIDIGTDTIEVPANGLTITGYSFDLSGIITSAENGVIFSSPVGGSGNLILNSLLLSATGVNGKVFDLTDATGFNAFEFNAVNYIACASLGSFTSYRQGLEVGTGRFGGTPKLTLIGNMVGGFRISTSIVRGISAATGTLFEAGAGLVINGRFITDINCDLAGTVSLLDFAPSNIANNESLIISGAYFARGGVVNPKDTTITPNISADSVKCLWRDNTGIRNTHKYVKSTITTSAVTVINTVEVYEEMAGTWTENNSSHIAQIADNRWEVLSGNGTYQITGDFTIEGNQNTETSVSVKKSTDGGSNWVEINHTRRTINNLQGGRDVAFIPVNFITDLSEGDLIRLEIENYFTTSNFEVEAGSYLIISEV